MAAEQHLPPTAGSSPRRIAAVESERRLWAPADPVPLGLSGFAVTTAALSWILLGILPKADLPVVLPLAIFFGGGAQLLAGMWAFAERNSFAAAAFSGYGAFWLSFWLLNSVFIKQVPKAQQPGAEELFLILWGIFTFYLWIVSFRVSVAVNIVLMLLVPAYVLIGIGTGSESTALVHIGAGFGLACAAAAAYTAFAHVLNRTFERPVLPLGPR
ncbi:MAG TPA: acetate uptake transporter [Solirubrobacteraceae bacterium]|nr:acetate uptake transporter [Solirubrobacteraceae bacterium]